RDTKYLLYWMINVSNRLLRSSNGEAQSAIEVNTTGQTTVNGLISMSTLIFQHKEPVPNVIFRLFVSIINARSLVSETFQQLMGPDSDDELKRSNESHQHFIDTLRSAFQILGGEEWEKTSAAASDDTEDVEQILFANKFEKLTVHKAEGSSDEDDELDQTHTTTGARKVSRKPKGKKSKKTKKYKKTKKGKKQDTNDITNEEIPIESIRIIEDSSEAGLVTDYLLAVYSAVREWAELRVNIQSVWREVAYDGLNSAVAGAACNLATSMIKRTSAAIFVDFPGHDTYETIVKTITRGEMDKAQGNYRLTLWWTSSNNESYYEKTSTIDIKEQFLIHAYQDLKDFILDFQANRSGKPTKAMQAKIAQWDPNFDLRRATNQDRINWRRCYTIRWLYDLVNVYSSVVVQRNTMKGENHIYEKVDWSANGPWGVHRIIFGLKEFAGDVTNMAMKKRGTDITKMIYPHHVFQMQCIVDSFTVSRGWSLNPLHGHMLQAPAKKGRARRDVDLFLDRSNERMFAGYCQTVDLLKQFLEKDGKLDQHQDIFMAIKIAQRDFVNFLGEHKYTTGIATIPPSRFSDHNANGLQEYSPYLCGAGLEEGLEIAYRLGMLLWDRMPEPTLMIHLHNAVVQKGYLSRPVGICQALENMFKETFFTQGRRPESAFGDALLASIRQPGSQHSQAQKQALRSKFQSANDILQYFDTNFNQLSQRSSILTTYRSADWNLEVIPDEELECGTVLFFERLGRTMRFSDSKLEDDVLVRKARASGMTDENIIWTTDKLAATLAEGVAQPGPMSEAPKDNIATCYRSGPWSPSDVPSSSQLLDIAKADLLADVAGSRPLSSLNYLGVTCWLLDTFMLLEKRLKEARDRVYVTVYEKPGSWQDDKRVCFAVLALEQENEECLKIVADTLNETRCGFVNFIYWEGLELEPQQREDMNFADLCTVM
ncbi:hypothetical protein IL306_004853, partial [Fusarium sp. DS 682]